MNQNPDDQKIENQHEILLAHSMQLHIDSKRLKEIRFFDDQMI